MIESTLEDSQQSGNCKVLQLRQRIMPHHRTLLAKWLDAGRCMGLCDAWAYVPVRGETHNDYVLVWVRENADPAYMVAPEGMHWVVTDCVRQHTLARPGTFEAALQLIRPVLQLNVAA
jgi:hypothetical protein